jgi:hypothetical protein
VSVRHVTDDGYRLGSWVRQQRNALGVDKLTDSRVAALEALSGWTWDPFEDDWQDGLEHLRAYVERKGHVRPPNKYVEDDGYRLGFWVSNQRKDLRAGRLADDRVEALEAFPGWTWNARKPVDADEQ